jgi:protease-4
MNTKHPVWALAFTVALTPMLPARADGGAFQPQELGSLSSVATVNDASALAVNPAALAFEPGTELFLSRSLNGLEQTNFFLAGNGFGSSWQQYRSNGRFLNDLTLGTSANLGYGLSLGGNFSYLQFLDNLGGNSATFDLSAMYRPNGVLSMGLSVQNLNNPVIGANSLKRYYRAGLGVRPFGDRLTLSLDGGWSEGDPSAQITPWLGVSAMPLSGLTINALVNNQLDYSLGLGFQFDQVGTGFLSGISHNRAAESDLLYATSSGLEAAHSLPLGFPHVAYMRLEGNLHDQPGPFDLQQRTYPGVLKLVERIDQAKEDSRVTGLVLELNNVRAGLADIQAVRDAVARFRTYNKPVVAYVVDAGMGAYYLATSANQIIQSPAGSLDITGLSSSIPFFHGVLEKLGIHPEFVAIGKYKSAPQQYTRSGPTAPAKEEEDALLDAQYEQMVDGIASARRMTPLEVKALIAHGMFTPPRAKEKNLIDAISYPDEVPTLLGKGRAIAQSLHIKKPTTWAIPDEISVISIDGTIARGLGGHNLIDGASVGSATLAAALSDARQNPNVKAVVIEIDSPGGDAVAADEIGRQIDLLRLAKKPVIVSMGNVAASGGYWAAAAGDRIYAEPGTITGSIGVFSGQFIFSGLMNTLGVTVSTSKRGAHADMGSGFRPLSKEELALLGEQARYTYVQFLNRVAKGRHMTPSAVDAIAQGRVWAGTSAKGIGLVDRFGDLQTAIDDAYKSAKLNPYTTMLAFYPRPENILEALSANSMDAQLSRTLDAAEGYSRVKNRLLMPGAASTP